MGRDKPMPLPLNVDEEIAKTKAELKKADVKLEVKPFSKYITNDLIKLAIEEQKAIINKKILFYLVNDTEEPEISKQERIIAKLEALLK